MAKHMYAGRTLFVGAIEIGTQFSMVAFSFGHDPSRVWAKNWANSDHVQTTETPTCILIKPDGKSADSFGYVAETKYIELITKQKQTNYYFFKGIKGLDTVEGTIGAPIDAVDELGKKMDATFVLSMIIKCLQDEIISTQGEDIRTNFKDICWVLAIPAGSSPLFLKLMKDSAKMAGIDEKKLLVITSTDSAAILFTNPPDLYRTSWRKPKPGSKFLTVIAGDEYLDTVVHNVEVDGKVRQVSALKRGAWGLAIVSSKFEELLSDILGRSVYQLYKHDMQEDWLEAMLSFKQKVMSTSFEDEWITMKLPTGLPSLLKTETGKTMSETIANSSFAHDVKLKNDKLRISLAVFKQMFDVALKQIIWHIKSVMGSMDVSAIFMTGKFADVRVFRDTMISSFSDVPVVFTEVKTQAILEGAVNALYNDKNMMLFTGPKVPVVVASIDFGTTYSGWSTSYREDFLENPTKASVRQWTSDSAVTDKTPTHVLIREDGKTAKSFGYGAISQYRELVANGDEHSFYYFWNFKMSLFKKLKEKLDRNITLEDEAGHTLPALDVFGASIKFLKDDFLKQCEKELIGSLAEEEVQWVITVPAIWSDGAKQFMREAAIKAGIKSRRLLLALEPEAASIYCRHLPVEARDEGSGSSVSSFKCGTKYLILDAGGGTVDITVHEVIDKNSVKEVHAASGGGWGGMMVNNAFEKLMEALTGEDVYRAFCKEEIDDHLELLGSFEIKKRTVEKSTNSLIRMTIPLSLIGLYKSMKHSSLEKDIMNSEFAANVKLQKNKIAFSADIIRGLFKDPIDNILCHVDNLLKETKVTAILMVGGFSDSPLLQSAVKEKFSDIEVIVPRESATAILKGALIFGHMPRQITERVLKYTYGVKVLKPFQKGKHPESKRVSSDAGDKCKDIFDKHVQKNQSVKVGQPQSENSYSPINKSQKSLNVEMFASELEDPQFTDQNCTCVGRLTVDLTDHDGDLSRVVTVALTFGDTEIVVEAKDAKTGEQTSVAIDFLG